MRKVRWNYNGDSDLRQGGFFWRGDAPDYVEAVRVTPCSSAGGPDNLWLVESGPIHLPLEADRRRVALSCFGMGLDSSGFITGYHGRDRVSLLETIGRRVLVEAFLAYHGVEADSSRVVQIGRVQEAREDGFSPNPDVVLRRSASLYSYVRREFLR